MVDSAPQRRVSDYFGQSTGRSEQSTGRSGQSTGRSGQSTGRSGQSTGRSGQFPGLPDQLPYAQLPWQAKPVGDAAARPWLTSTDSLTRKLVDRSHGQFAVEVLQQDRAFCGPGQGVPLGHGLYWRREVLLRGHDEPWVRALTLVPVRHRQLCARLQLLGTRPLGAFLFSQPSLRRRQMDYAASPWGLARRTRFTIRHQQIILIELFLNQFLEQL